MDFLNKLSESDKNKPVHTQNQGASSGGGGFMGKLNTMAGGGKQSEKNEDALDKGNLAT